MSGTRASTCCVYVEDLNVFAERLALGQDPAFRIRSSWLSCNRCDVRHLQLELLPLYGFLRFDQEWWYHVSSCRTMCDLVRGNAIKGWFPPGTSLLVIVFYPLALIATQNTRSSRMQTPQERSITHGDKSIDNAAETREQTCCR
jgi:hypothetical protein